MIERIGFVGLEIMGRPMALNLMEAGYELTVHNRSRAKVDELVAEGAVPAGSPKEVAETAQIDGTVVLSWIFKAPLRRHLGSPR